MTLNEITSALKSTNALPVAALQAGLTKAEELAPLVYAIAERFCRGTYLLPEDNALLFYGLHILAAARHPGLFDHTLEIASQPDDDLNRLFPDHIPTSLARLLLTVWNDDADMLFRFIEHADLIPDVKWALFDVLARLTFDGRIPRKRTIAFLDCLERDKLIEDGDSVWWGWEAAVTKLGIKQLEPALRRVWSKVINEHHTEQDHAESLEQLNRAAADPTDPSVFDQEEVRPIEDPVEAIDWVERRAKWRLVWRAEREAEQDFIEDDDPAKAIRLTDDECDWLAGLLVSRQAPESTMSFEMLDGFLTALVIGPATVPPSKYLSEIWGTDDGAGPEWESIEQTQYFMSLLTRHWNGIAARRNTDSLHVPFILEFGDAEYAQPWAQGFTAGVELGHATWDKIFKDKRADELIMSIFALAQDDSQSFKGRLKPKMRAEIVEQLPVILQIIAAYWRNPELRLPRFEPIRSTKVGRNDPCPCGSGKKFKRCCAVNSLPTLH